MNWINKIGKEDIHFRINLRDFETFQKFIFTLNVEWQDSGKEIINIARIYYSYVENNYVYLKCGNNLKLRYEKNLSESIIFDLRKLKFKKILE